MVQFLVGSSFCFENSEFLRVVLTYLYPFQGFRSHAPLMCSQILGRVLICSKYEFCARYFHFVLFPRISQSSPMCGRSFAPVLLLFKILWWCEISSLFYTLSWNSAVTAFPMCGPIFGRVLLFLEQFGFCSRPCLYPFQEFLSHCPLCGSIFGRVHLGTLNLM